MSAPQPARPTLFSSFVLWIAIAGTIAPVAYIVTMAVLFTYYKTYREPGWGTNREAFPLLIVTHDPAGKPVANIAGAGDLGRLSNYTFNIPKSERAQIDRTARSRSI